MDKPCALIKAKKVIGLLNWAKATLKGLELAFKLKIRSING